MSQRRTWKIVLSAALSAFVSKATAQAGSSQYYPDASLVQIYTQEQIEQKKADELEQKRLQQQDQLERQKRSVEQQVAAHRYQIEGLKMQQEKAQEELDQIGVDLQHVNSDLSSYQAEHQQLDDSTKATLQYLETQRSDMVEKQKTVDAELHALSEARKRAEHDVYQMAMEIERMKVDIARNETRVQEAEAKRAAVEADEMKIRADWMQAKMQSADHMRQRDEALNQLAEAKKRLDQANQELSAAKADLAKTEKQRNDVDKKSKAEVAQYERDIQTANKIRVAKDAERQHMEIEMAKIQEYNSLLKEAREESMAQQGASEGLVLKTSLALESAKSALTGTVETTEQANYKNQKLLNQARGIAAADAASQMVEGGHMWVTTENCKAYKAPSTKKPAGYFGSGKRLVGKDHGSNWVEIINGDGASVFMPSHCGKYED